MNFETREVYHKMFMKMFKILKEIVRKSVDFVYIISDQDFRIITIDMNNKQIAN